MIKDLVDTMLDRLKKIVETDTVVGKPIQVESTTVIPITKISLGFAAGTGGSKENNEGAGTGGGAVIEPIAVVTIQDGIVKVSSLKKSESNLHKVLEIVPDIVKKFDKSSSKKEK